jgi:hypothetical protein
MPVYFDPAGSVFVVFKKAEKKQNNIVSVAHNGADVTGSTKKAIEFSGDNNIATLWESGIYDILKADGQKRRLSALDIPQPIPFIEPWTLTFPDGWGAPGHIELLKLISYSDYPDEGVKYFSGTVTGTPRFQRRYSLTSPTGWKIFSPGTWSETCQSAFHPRIRCSEAQIERLLAPYRRSEEKNKKRGKLPEA